MPPRKNPTYEGAFFIPLIFPSSHFPLLRKYTRILDLLYDIGESGV